MLADADVVAGLETGGAKGRDHPDLVQALLEIGERLFVFEVVALEQQLDPAPDDPEAAVVLALDRVAALAGRTVDTVLGLELGRPGLTLGAGDRILRQLGQDPLAELAEALAGGRGDRHHPERALDPPARPTRPAPPRPPPR